MTDTTHSTTVEDTATTRYTYSTGEVAGRFLAGLKEGKILATRCSKSGLTYLPPRLYCERSFELCDSWIEAQLTGEIEVATIVSKGFEGAPPTPYALAYVRLDNVDTAIGGFVRDLDMADVPAAMLSLSGGAKVRVVFNEERVGDVTDFYFLLV